MEECEYYQMDAIEKDHWWFVAKRKFVGTVLDRFVKDENIKSLDVGCGTGAVMEMFIKRGYNVEGVDPSDTALGFCKKKNLIVTKGIAGHLPYPDNSFDVVTALDVLEHVQEDIQAVIEIYRVLKPGGIFISTVPAHQFLFSSHDKALHHFRRYSRSQFQKILSSSTGEILYLGWIHMAIFLPAVLLRMCVRIFGDRKSKSDVKMSNPVLNTIMDTIYVPELTWFKKLHLPWGLSLIGVVRKK